MYAKCPDRKLKEGAIRDFFPASATNWRGFRSSHTAKRFLNLPACSTAHAVGARRAALGFAKILRLRLNHDEADACKIT